MLYKRSSSHRGGTDIRNTEWSKASSHNINCLPRAMEHNILKVFCLKAQIRHTDKHSFQKIIKATWYRLDKCTLWSKKTPPGWILPTQIKFLFQLLEEGTRTQTEVSLVTDLHFTNIWSCPGLCWRCRLCPLNVSLSLSHRLSVCLFLTSPRSGRAVERNSEPLDGAVTGPLQFF